MSKKSPTVAVVVPMYRSTLNRDEEISRRHLLHFLGGLVDDLGLLGHGLHHAPMARRGMRISAAVSEPWRDWRR